MFHAVAFHTLVLPNIRASESKQDIQHVRGRLAFIPSKTERETRFRCPRFVFRPSPLVHVARDFLPAGAAWSEKTKSREIITIRGQNFPRFVLLLLFFVICLIYMRIPTIAICTAASKRCQVSASMRRQSCKYLFFLSILSLSPT